MKTIKIKKKSKKISLAKLDDICAVLTQKLIRLKAADEFGYCKCTTCDNRDHYKRMQGGHFIPRGNKATKLMEENIHPQCKGCNGFGMKYGNAEKHYTLYMEDMYGREFVDEMLATVGKPFKFFRPNLEDLQRELNAQIKELEKQFN